FAPIALGVDYLYPWVHASADDTLLREKSIYLNVPFFISRAIVYFLLWCGLGWLLLRWSAATVDGEAPAGLRRLSGPGLIVYGLGMTFAAIDWMMSLEPHWFSSIFGVIVVAAQVLSAFAFAVLALAWRSRP